MIIFGTRSIKTSPIKTNLVCSFCRHYHSVVLIPYQRYFHIFWIPTFPIGKEYVEGCVNCGKSWSPSQNADRRIQEQIKTPLWSFIGLGLIVLFILYVIIIGL